MREENVAAMTEETKTFLQVVGIASLGGVVNWIRHPKGGHGPVALMCSIITAAFTGMQAHFLVNWMGLSVDLQFAIAGMAGYGGGVLLDAAIPILIAAMRRGAGLKDEGPDAR